MTHKPRILLIYTGGTIGMSKGIEKDILVPFDFEKLEENILELQQLDCETETFSFDPPIDSSNMHPGHWIKMVYIIQGNYDRFDGFVILHGSDTMSYSAAALSFMLCNLAKPVIFTGSQLPVGDLRTDAKENLITAIQLASLTKNGRPFINEVGLYFEYKLYRGNRTTKINAEHFQAFASLNYPPLAESGVHLKVYEENLLPPPKDAFYIRTALDNCVGILKIFPGMSPEWVTAALNTPGLRGLILETFGAGNAPTSQWLIESLREALEAGLKIVNVTQCSGGAINMGQYETSKALKEMGILSGGDMTTEAALAKMMVMLGMQMDDSVFKKSFETPMTGECS